MASIAQYQRFDNDGLELVIDTATGEAFATISGYARMAGLTQPAISQRVSRSHNKIEVKTAEIQTDKGIRAITLINEETISQWIIRDNPDLALKMMQAGVRVFLHKSAGYQVSSVLYRPDHRLDPEWQIERQDGKDVRRSLTDATKAWIERNFPNMKPWEKRRVYAAHSDALNIALFGRSAKELIEYFDCSKNKLRDQFSKYEIAALRSLEWAAIRKVDIGNLHPVDAINEAVQECLAKGMFVDHYTEPLPAMAPKQKQKRVAKQKAPKALPKVEKQLRLF